MSTIGELGSFLAREAVAAAGPTADTPATDGRATPVVLTNRVPASLSAN